MENENTIISQGGQDIKELAAAMVKFQGAVQNPKTTSENPYFNSKYADLAEIWSVVRKPLHDCGLAVIQGANIREEIKADENYVVTKAHVQTMLIHESGQSLSFTLELIADRYDKTGNLLPMTPQGIGSAITFGRRYGFAAILGIAQEDDDGNAASKTDAAEKNKSVSQPIGEGKTLAECVIGMLDKFYQDPKTTKNQVAQYLKPLKRKLDALPTRDKADIKAMHTKLMERFAPAPKTTGPDDAPPEEKKIDWGMSLKRVSFVCDKLDKATSTDQVMEIMNCDYTPFEPEMDQVHKNMIIKVQKAALERVKV